MFFTGYTGESSKIEMINFNLNTQIYRPLQEVFCFIATPENDFQWQYGTLASTQISEGDIGVGTLFRTINHFIGRRIESIYEVTEFEPDKKYGFRSLSGPMRSRTLYTFQITEGSTKINMSSQTNPEDIFKMNDATVEKKIRKQYRENLNMLKSVLETHRIVRT